MKLAIIDYPGAIKSAAYGLSEMFALANRLCAEHDESVNFDTEIIQLTAAGEIEANEKNYSAIILPPAIDNVFYLNPSNAIKNWLIQQHQRGSMLCSACAGAFILAATGLLDKREATTHWGLVGEFKQHYPAVRLNASKIMVNDQDVITAGGMLSWLDLGLELIAQFTSPSIMRQLGKLLVVDTGQREQRYYQQFSPRFTHADELILKVQQKLQSDYSKPIKISALAEFCCLTERTFLRRFFKASGLNPSEYLQRLRVQKACDMLESTQDSFELIATRVGYEDINACRKIFVRIVGLTPREFRKRFVNQRIDKTSSQFWS
jgi:transcriptional regulator GlxA family with amidase domain